MHGRNLGPEASIDLLMPTFQFSSQYHVNRSILELYRKLGPDRISRFQDEFALSDVEDVWRQPLVLASRLARQIVKHFQLPDLVVIVDHNDQLEAPGQVTLTNSDALFVEIRRDVFWPKPLAALLSHEIAHIFLHRHGIRFDDTFENEVLTDTTAAFLGFGATILGGVTEGGTEQCYFAGRHHTRSKIHYFGYISLPAFGYILAKREKSLGKNCAVGLEGSHALAALADGRAFVARERRQRPFVPRPALQRGIGTLLRKDRKPIVPSKIIEFDCPNCSQGLRIPEAYRQMMVRCKTCKSHFTCYA